MVDPRRQADAMSPRALDLTVRNSLSEAAIAILGTEGREALSARRLAREAGTSTTAVYTYFGGMDEVHRDVRRRELDTLLEILRTSHQADDPVADLARLTTRYVRYGADNRARYRVMFVDQPPDDDGDPAEDVFDVFRQSIEACVTDGRFEPDGGYSPALWAGEVWTACHGVVMLASSGLLARPQIDAMHTDLLYRLCMGFGDDGVHARSSIDSLR
ncbi:TetR/AcrR family transcriptional regulator [Gordonia hydrophobica]|uniref:TetR/AcrR family transcriptional regulator n=1 Tax=Gordonia hydrophobica TaxID=40516 RepID=A0ABZ2TZT0_9ACTN|nr:TetR/AcrR family transcriptional regulator [Gordonia hydrophobica]MBM7369419.1 AcrR family transcriptional regulator [Gordonia hydrophobica]